MILPPTSEDMKRNAEEDFAKGQVADPEHFHCVVLPGWIRRAVAAEAELRRVAPFLAIHRFSGYSIGGPVHDE